MKKILICDDEADIREILAMLIDLSFDVEISFAHDGKDCIEQITNQDFDLIICDYNMPNLKGNEVFKINLDLKNTPFILISGDLSKNSVLFQNIKECNPKNAVLPKPWNDDELISILDNVIAA